MRDGATCEAWRPDECDGFETCPPRCPRFVDADGRASLFRVSPSGDDRSRLRLEAVRDWATAVAATLAPAADGRYAVTVDDWTPEASPALAHELLRQAAAYAVEEGATSLAVDTTTEAAPITDAARRVGFQERDDGLVLPLTGDGLAATPESRPQATTSDTPRTSERELDSLFRPDRVAVVGATDREGAIGRTVVENLRDGFAGDVVPVTPATDTVLGEPTVSDLRDTSDVDLAVVVLPPDLALEAVEAAGEGGVDAVAVLSAGFEEAGDDGAARARRLERLAAEYDLTVLGPNSLGVLNAHTGLNASFSPRRPTPGSVSLLSQSGAFVTAALEQGADAGIGFAEVASLGNKAALDETDLIERWGADPDTDVILGYLEAVEDGERFVETAREVAPETPIVLLKAGRTDAGAAAAASHTGSLAGADDVVDAAFEEAGVVRADSVTELFDYARVLQGRLPDGDRVGVVTNAGGPGVLAADAVADEDLALADLSPDVRERLEADLPASAGVDNPVDVLGDADADRFDDALHTVLGDDAVDVGFVLTTPHPLVDEADLAERIGMRAAAADKPVVACFLGGSLDPEAHRRLRQYRVPAFDDPTEAAGALAALVDYVESREALRRERPTVPTIDVPDVVHDARDAGRDALGVDGLSLLADAGVPTAETTVVESASEAERAAAALGDRVVLKVVSPDLAHKADVGGVAVDVAPADAGDAYERMREQVAEEAPDATVDGVAVQPMVDDPDAVEVVVGATRDPTFGPVVMFGLGGVFVETLDDVAFALAPLDEARACELVDSVAASALLDGARGAAPVDRDALVAALVAVSELAASVPAIAELDVNPLVATPDGVTAVDAYLSLADDETGENERAAGAETAATDVSRR
jgi:acetyl coenzyme A synthetase (ADP forming)-like protein